MSNFINLIKRKDESVIDYSLTRSNEVLLGLVEQMKNLVLQAEKVKLIRELGFTNSEESFEIQGVMNLLEIIKNFYSTMKSLVDKNDETFFIPNQVFKEILNKYDLLCGTFDKYKGNIPLENLKIIKEVRDRMKNSKGDLGFYTGPIDVCYKIEILISSVHSYQHSLSRKISDMISNGEFLKRSSGVLMDFYRFPLSVPGYSEVRQEIIRIIQEIEYSNSWEDRRRSDFLYDINIYPKSTDNLFICAPASKMNPMLENISCSVKKRELTKDPLIISTSFGSAGVIVHTGWGMEMNLDAVKRYKESTRMFLVTAKPFMEGMKQIV